MLLIGVSNKHFLSFNITVTAILTELERAMAVCIEIVAVLMNTCNYHALY